METGKHPFEYVQETAESFVQTAKDIGRFVLDRFVTGGWSDLPSDLPVEQTNKKEME